MPILFLLALACCLAPGAARRQCSVEAGSTISGNIDGELLVLDAGALVYRGPHPAGPAIADASACAATCSLLPGCNSWTFCSRAAGCGSGCSKWAAAHPKLTPVAGIADTRPANASLPVRSFGPWTFPQNANGCQYAGGASTDAWPFGLCSLKRVADPKAPKLYSSSSSSSSSRTAAVGVTTEAAAGGGQGAPDAEGWVSGTLIVSPDCKDVPAKVCRLCGATPDPAKCLRCAKDARAQHAEPLDNLLKRGNAAQEACSVCTNNATVGDAAQQDRCFDCILGNKTCSTCIYGAQMWGFGPPNVGACLTCAARKGDAYAAACNACAQSRQPGRCFACLDSIAPSALCKPGELPGGASGCRIAPNDQTPCDLCSNSAKSDAAFKQCVACHGNEAWTQECSDCGSLPSTAALQERCYACVTAARFPSYTSSGCAACFNPSVVPPDRATGCLACVEASATPFAAKASCASCAAAAAAPLQQQQQQQTGCLACLQRPQAAGFDYSAACLGRPRL